MRATWIVALVVGLNASARAADERVTLPLSLWDQVQDALRPPPPSRPELAWCGLSRTLTGAVKGGLLTATLDVRFEVFETEGWLDVPLLDAEASLVSVEVDGAPASLRREGDFYVVGMKTPGVHRARIRFLQGRAGDRLEGSLSVQLPEAGPTRLRVTIPEVDVEVALAEGVVLSAEAVGPRTRVEGRVNGPVELTWSGAAPAVAEARLTARQHTLLTVQPSMVSGRAVFDLGVEEGAVDRVRLQAPASLEVVRLTGDAVLQWRTEPDGGVVVLFTEPLEAPTRFEVEFQVPAPEAAVQLTVPALPVPTQGHLGVLAASGLEVTVGATQEATPVATTGLPAEILAMTPHPLSYGFSHAAQPQLELRVTQNPAVALTGIIIDDLEASTVLLEDGTEISKVRLFMRNNARQYLGVRLPEAARLTHALIDGVPVTPAVEADGDRVLVPLRQSSRVDGGRVHRVQPGETLGAIAYIYYSNPQKWPLIVEANDDLYGPEDMMPGQELRIPAQEGVAIEESRFVFEFAWRRAGDALTGWGTRRVALAELDVEVIKATWHLYLPQAVEPMRFEANLGQYSAVRYDLFRRFGMFIRRALAGDAQAGVLEQRKALYLADTAGEGRAALGAFPLVGERYRFKRLLLGEDTPAVTVTYVGRHLARGIKLGVVLFAALLVFLTLRPRSGLISGLFGLLALAPLLVLGYHLNGVYRHLVWGLDLGLLALLLRHGLAPLRRLGRTPRALGVIITPRALLGALALLALLRGATAFPMFLPLAALVALALGWIRARQTPELRDA